jgi:hypothetical protein
MECLVVVFLFSKKKKKDVEMSMAKSVGEVQDMDLLVRVTWNTLG